VCEWKKASSSPWIGLRFRFSLRWRSAAGAALRKIFQGCDLIGIT